MVGISKTARLIKSMQRQSFEPKAAIMTEMYLPNHSGIASHPEAKNTFLARAQPIVNTSITNFVMGDDDGTLIVDASGANKMIRFDPAAGLKGYIFTIKKEDSSSNTVTLNPSNAETIDGSITVVITAQFASITIQSDGNEWWIL